MGTLDMLLEYKESPLQGTPLSKSKKVKYDPTAFHHHRYHQTKAGLYVVLRHLGDGTIQKNEYTEEGSSSFSFSNSDGQDESLPDLFAFKSNLYHFDPVFKKSVTQSTTYHHSGIRVVHITDSLDETILSVELSGWTKFEEAEVPAWRLRIQRNPPPGSPYRGGPDPAVEGDIFSYQKHTLRPYDRVKTASPKFEGKRINHEHSVERILDLMDLYFVSREREKYAKHLNSPDCLIFE